MNISTPKIVAAVVCLIVFLFGFICIFYITTVADRSEGKHTDGNFSLYTFSGVVVDKSGRIYYGNSGHNIVQVFNNNGDFQYYFSVPHTTSGNYYIYLNEEDEIKIAISSINAVYVYKDGMFLRKDMVDPADMSNIIRVFEAVQKREYYDEDGHTYRLLHGKTVGMFDRNTGALIREIKPNTPIWPLPIPVYMALCGLALMVLLFGVVKLHLRFRN